MCYKQEINFGCVNKQRRFQTWFVTIALPRTKQACCSEMESINGHLGYSAGCKDMQKCSSIKINTCSLTKILPFLGRAPWMKITKTQVKLPRKYKMEIYWFIKPTGTSKLVERWGLKMRCLRSKKLPEYTPFLTTASPCRFPSFSPQAAKKYGS